MNKLFAISILGAAYIATTPIHSNAQAQITKQGDGYLFRMKFVKGQTVSYGMNIAMNMGAGSAAQKPMAMTMKQTVKSVKGDTATIEVSSSGMPGAQAQKQTVTMNTRGEVVGGQGSGVNVALPAKPVKIGSTWTGDLSGMMGAGGGGKATYKFVSVKTVGGQQVAEIAISMNAKLGQGMSMTGNGTVYMRLADASLQSMSLKSAMAMPAQKGGKPTNMTMNMTMNRK